MHLMTIPIIDLPLLAAFSAGLIAFVVLIVARSC